MKKNILWALIIIIAALGVFAVFGVFDSSFRGGFREGDGNPEAILSGEIISMDGDQVAADGPYVVTIRNAAGGENVIAIPSMGILLCEARESIAAIDTLTPGAHVEVRGAVSEDGSIVPCEKPSHYMRIVSVDQESE